MKKYKKNSVIGQASSIIQLGLAAGTVYMIAKILDQLNAKGVVEKAKTLYYNAQETSKKVGEAFGNFKSE